MSSTAAVIDQPAAAEQPSAARNRLVLVVYTAAIFVSALLLFSVQPLFTKMVLPRLGGSPAVWSVAMVFFQSLLLAGYAYAHLLMQIKNRTIPVAVHLVLLRVAIADAAAVDRERLGRAADLGLCVLAARRCSWSRSACRSSRSRPTIRCCRPGSCAPAIPPGPIPTSSMRPPISAASSRCLSYPVLLEPMFTLRTQNLIWTGGYGLLILLIAGCGVLLLRSPALAAADRETEETVGAGAELAAARALDLSRRGAVGPADRGDRAHLDRRRGRAAALGAAAVALSAHLGAGVPVAPAVAAQMDADDPAARDRGRDRAARGRRRAEPAADARRPSTLLLRHRDGLPWRAGAHAAGREISHRLLCRAVVRRHGRRPVRRPDCALHVLLDRRISDPGRARCAVPPGGQ